MRTLNDEQRMDFVEKLMKSGAIPGAENNGGVENSVFVRRFFKGAVGVDDAEDIAYDWTDAYVKANPDRRITRDEVRRIAAATHWLGDGTDGNHIEVYRGSVTGEIRIFDLVGDSTIQTEDTYLGMFKSKTTVKDTAYILRNDYGNKVPVSLTA